jgi:hypothetical protein
MHHLYFFYLFLNFVSPPYFYCIFSILVLPINWILFLFLFLLLNLVGVFIGTSNILRIFFFYMFTTTLYSFQNLIYSIIYFWFTLLALIIITYLFNFNCCNYNLSILKLHHFINYLAVIILNALINSYLLFIVAAQVIFC